MLITYLLLALAAILLAWRVVYVLYFHPLAKYPGPLLARLTDLYYAYYAWKGDIHLKIYEDHQIYGDFLRYGPNLVLVCSAPGLHDIYGTGSASSVIKSGHYVPLEHKAPSTFTARDRKDHLRRRRIVSQTLSDKAQRGYKERITRHVNKLCDVLYPESQPAGTWTAPLDMANWCNYLTFDIMSDVVFSAYYNLLGSDRFRYITDMISKSNIRMSVLVIIPWLTSFNFDHYCFKASIIARFRFLKFVIRCVRERVERGKNKGMSIEMPEDSVSGGAGGDVFEALDTAKDSKTGESLRPDELASESITLIVAGSETSSTAIASVLFYVADNKDVYNRVAAEVRSCPDDDSLPSCTYLRACIDEAMRMSPPNGAVLGREVTAPAGLLVDGSRVGTGCNMGVGIYAIHHDSRYYKDPFVYNPTRWLEDDGSGDSIERARYAFTPFSIGMRSCVGKSLAYHEIATTIGTILRRGDFCFADGELGLIGRGKKGAIGGRHRENEFQLHEHIAGHKNGPWLQFAPRGI
ncbi:hypothetical protein FDECE_5813 [Fusarium decemcellulare]|nr:hypothetical protein FDECE_5813 [Fusarium decemcellulare]